MSLLSLTPSIDSGEYSTPSSPVGTLFYFDPDPGTAKLTLAGLGLAGYEVEHFSDADAAIRVLEGPDAGDYSAVVLDAGSSPDDARRVAEATSTDGDGDAQPNIIVMTTKARPVPFPGAERFPVLKRPFATPALVRLVKGRVRQVETSGPPALGSGSEQVPSAAQNSTQVGKYELIAEIARGGMGTVYLCRRAGESGFQRLYAMKVLHRHLEDREAFIKMLLDEARLAAKIHHPNVASVVDLDRDETGHYYIVMDYVEGCSLSQLLKRTRDGAPVELVVPIIVSTLEGLHAAHILADASGQPLGIIHRDISPQNILVGTDGVARIADFGVAKAHARLSETEAGTLKGKLAYSAPEQLLDDDTIDCRADVFAAGIVLWEALTGRKLFRAGSDAATIRNILDKKVPKPSEVGGPSLLPYDDVCLRALERDPNHRYETAQEMAEVLRERSLAARTFGSPSRIGAWVRKAYGQELEQRRLAIQLVQEGEGDFTPPPFPIDGLVAARLESRPTRDELVASEITVADGSPALPHKAQTGRWMASVAAGVAAVLLLGGGAWLAMSGTGNETIAPANLPVGHADGKDAKAPNAVSSPPALPDPSVAPPRNDDPPGHDDLDAVSADAAAPDEDEPAVAVILDETEAEPPSRKRKKGKSPRTRGLAPGKRPASSAPTTARPEPTHKPAASPPVESNPYR